MSTDHYHSFLTQDLLPLINPLKKIISQDTCKTCFLTQTAIIILAAGISGFIMFKEANLLVASIDPQEEDEDH